MIKPTKEKEHSIGNGLQRIYKFNNGFGISAVRFKLQGMSEMIKKAIGREYGSYTNNENEWEIGVIEFDDPKNPTSYNLTYETPITNDVIGYVTEEGLQYYLELVKALPKRKEKK